MAQGLTGTVVAERFLLLAAEPPVSGWTTINYAQPLPKNLTATETGLIHWKRSSHDLITAAQLNQWADPTNDDGWQLTRESVTDALKPGRKISQLLNLLNLRLKPSMPPLLEIALRSWAGAIYPVELESVIVLRCPQDQVFKVIITSPLMAAFLKGYIYPDLLFVDPEQLEALRHRLDWLGWKISNRLQIVPFRNSVDG